MECCIVTQEKNAFLSFMFMLVFIHLKENQKGNHTSLVPNLNGSLCLGLWFLKNQVSTKGTKAMEKRGSRRGGGGEGQGPRPLSLVLSRGRESCQNPYLHGRRRAMQGDQSKLVSNNISSTTDGSKPNSSFNSLQGQLPWRVSPESLLGSYCARNQCIRSILDKFYVLNWYFNPFAILAQVFLTF